MFTKEYLTESSRDLFAAALKAEYVRADRYRKALECAQDARVEEGWRRSLEAARSRIEALTRALDWDCPSESALLAEQDEDADCLVAAMDLALRNGDRRAAEAVAHECVVLAELQVAQAWERIRMAKEESAPDARAYRGTAGEPCTASAG